jgi:hypothetical protein
VHVVGGVIAAGGTLLMGASDNVALTCAGLLIVTPAYTVIVAPTSMWLSRVAGGVAQGAAFSMHKVVAALYLSLAMFVFGLLERWFGIRAVLLIGGSAGLVLSFGFFLLPDPPPPARGNARP